MPKFPGLDRTGERHGRLTVQRFAGLRGNTALWRCLCDCGNACTVSSAAQSCGCLQSERTAEANRQRIRHGVTRVGEDGKRHPPPEYYSWKTMKERCLNANAPNYHLYGGKGIKVCDRWLGKHGFQNFLADMGPRPEGMTLHRLRSGANYTPSNCQWASPVEQSGNRQYSREGWAAMLNNLKGGRKYWPRKD